MRPSSARTAASTGELPQARGLRVRWEDKGRRVTLQSHFFLDTGQNSLLLLRPQLCRQMSPLSGRSTSLQRSGKPCQMGPGP